MITKLQVAKCASSVGFVCDKAYDDAHYSYDVDDGLWDSESHQRRIRRDVINQTSNAKMSTSAIIATDSIVAQDEEASFYDDTDYYNNVYDDAAYDNYQLYAGQSQYNKV